MIIKKTLKFLTTPLNEKQSENNHVNLNLTIPKSYDSISIKFKSNYLIYRALKLQKLNARQGTKNTKTRSEVKGGGRKPWKQKGTGRARAGSTRSPLWKGGGVSFGPKSKTYKQKINRKEWRLSLRLLLLNKYNNIIIIENYYSKILKTKDFLKYVEFFINNSLHQIVIIVPKLEKNIIRITKNLKNIKLLQANCLNIEDILIAQHILIYKESLKIIEETYNDQ